ncbi:MAG: secretin N-terminal domain-containing protein, partial [Pseudomonadales bacterium]
MRIILSNTLLLTLALSLPGCSSTSNEEQPADDPVIDKMEKILQDATISERQQEEVPDNVSDALLPARKVGKDEGAVSIAEQRFDISVNEVPAGQFFLSLVHGTPLNIVVHPEVSGTVSLNLKNVTIPDVLESVRDMYGFEFVETVYGYQVRPGRLNARIFRIDHLNVERSGSSSTLVSSGAISTGSLAQDQGSGGNQSSQGSRSSGNVFGTKIETQQDEIRFWEELHTSILTIVGDADGRSVVVNPQSGIVVVRALPNELREVETYLRETQLIVQRQVILEAKVIEVKLNSRNQTGINWAAFFEQSGKTITAANVGGGSILSNNRSSSELAGRQSTLDPRNPEFLDNTTASAFGGVFSLAANFNDFTAFIELLESQGDVQILSSPRVSTMNNQKAVIKIGTDEFFVTDISTQNVSSSVATTITPDVTLTPFFSGIALDVTPQISEEGYVTLHVHPSISEVVDQEKTVT